MDKSKPNPIVKRPPVVLRPLRKDLAGRVSMLEGRFNSKSALASKLPLEEKKIDAKRERMKERNELPDCFSEAGDAIRFSGPRGEGCNIVSRDN